VSNEDIINKLAKLENKLIDICDTVINQDEKIKEQSKILEALYKELYGKKKKIQDLERSKTEKCRNNK
jgi:hypothetical protein